MNKEDEARAFAELGRADMERRREFVREQEETVVRPFMRELRARLKEWEPGKRFRVRCVRHSGIVTTRDFMDGVSYFDVRVVERLLRPKLLQKIIGPAYRHTSAQLCVHSWGEKKKLEIWLCAPTLDSILRHGLRKKVRLDFKKARNYFSTRSTPAVNDLIKETAYSVFEEVKTPARRQPKHFKLRSRPPARFWI